MINCAQTQKPYESIYFFKLIKVNKLPEISITSLEEAREPLEELCGFELNKHALIVADGGALTLYDFSTKRPLLSLIYKQRNCEMLHKARGILEEECKNGIEKIIIYNSTYGITCCENNARKNNLLIDRTLN